MNPFSVLHPAGIRLGREISLGEVAELAEVELVETGDKSCFWRIPVFTTSGVAVACSLYFSDNQLNQISIALHDSVKYGDSWEDATRSKEERRARDTELWLAAQGFPSGDYSWGTVWTGFDLKGFCGCGIVGYS